MSTRRRVTFLILPLAVLHAAVFFAGFLAPYDVASQNRELPFAPPSRIHFFDSNGHLGRPFIYSWKLAKTASPSTTRIVATRSRYISSFASVTIIGSLVLYLANGIYSEQPRRRTSLY